MELPGGGKNGLSSGQVSDESEIIIALTRGLVESGRLMSLTKICNNYYEWAIADSFKDLSRACFLEKDASKVASRAKDTGAKGNEVLWRAIPVILWSRNLTEE
jgi:ADP-ribosylglycohydrolase